MALVCVFVNMKDEKEHSLVFRKEKNGKKTAWTFNMVATLSPAPVRLSWVKVKVRESSCSAA